MIEKKTYVISDIHGGFKALDQCLTRCNFNLEKDQLICLGDVCDGWSQVVECVRLLSQINNLVMIMGNHDQWTYDWLKGHLKMDSFGLHMDEFRLWVDQGGKATIESIVANDAHQEVYDFLDTAVYYAEDNKRRLFVHGGIAPTSKAVENTDRFMIWDRDMVKEARYQSISLDPVCTEYDEVFCGHTPTVLYNRMTPTKYNNVWMMDTGAGYTGCLSIMDVNTKQCWQSDPLPILYEGQKAR